MSSRDIDEDDITSATGARFQAFPQAMSSVINPDGTMRLLWYRFFQTLWLQVCSGTTSDITLYNANKTAAVTQGDLAAEVNRATAAEANLQNQVNSLSASVTGNNTAIAALQGQVAGLNTTVAGLQSQINTINDRLTAAGIP